MNTLRYLIDGERVSERDYENCFQTSSKYASTGTSGGAAGDDEEEGEAPAPPAGEVPITLKVRDQTGEEMFFKVKKGTAMTKIFDAYATRRGVAKNTLRFMLDEKRLKDTDTPKMLEMEDDDQIDVFLEQVGGSDNEEEAPATQAPAPPAGEVPITLKVRDQTGEEMFFKVKKGTQLSKIFDAYATRRGVGANTLRFMLEGKRVTGTDTPKMLELEDDDQIDVVLEQTGGMDDGAEDEEEEAAPVAAAVAAPPLGEMPITLKVRDQTGEEMFFKVKKGTVLSKIFDAYATRRGVGVAGLRFMFDGEKINGADTPKMHEMNDDDQIDVFLEQVGGN